MVVSLPSLWSIGSIIWKVMRIYLMIHNSFFKTTEQMLVPARYCEPNLTFRSFMVVSQPEQWGLSGLQCHRAWIGQNPFPPQPSQLVHGGIAPLKSTDQCQFTPVKELTQRLYSAKHWGNDGKEACQLSGKWVHLCGCQPAGGIWMGRSVQYNDPTDSNGMKQVEEQCLTCLPASRECTLVMYLWCNNEVGLDKEGQVAKKNTGSSIRAAIC